MKKADTVNYTEIKITCTLKVINYITPSCSPSSEIMVVDVAEHMDCVPCAKNYFNAFHVLTHFIPVTSHCEYE